MGRQEGEVGGGEVLSREDLLVVVQQGSCEVVDGSDGTERHGSILAPKQIGPKHHGQVSVVHLVHLTPC